MVAISNVVPTATRATFVVFALNNESAHRKAAIHVPILSEAAADALR
jgi:hypothetical protein